MSIKKNATGLDSVGSAAETAVMTIHHPATDEPLTDDDGNEMYIEVYGQDSRKYKQVQNDQINRRIAKAQRSGGRMNMTAEQQDAQNLEVLSKCTASWYIVLEGETPELSESKARDVYQRFPWLRDQVDAFIHDRKAFLTN